MNISMLALLSANILFIANTGVADYTHTFIAGVTAPLMLLITPVTTCCDEPKIFAMKKKDGNLRF